MSSPDPDRVRAPRWIAAAALAAAVASAGGTIATEHARILTRNFFSMLRLARRRTVEPMNCLIADWELASGVATSSALILDTQDVVVIGEGSIDLASRTLDLRFVPRPRNPSPLSTAASVSVTGSFDAPVVSRQKGSLLASSTRALLGTVMWLSRTRGPLRELLGTDAAFRRCTEPLTEDG